MRRAILLCLLATLPAAAQDRAERIITVAAASNDGSVLVLSIEDSPQSFLVALQPSTNKVLWTVERPNAASALAISPDAHIVAAGYHAFGETDTGMELLDAASGQTRATQVEGPGGPDDQPLGQGYASWGGGVQALFFTPRGDTLVGLSNDTLFAWNPATKKFLWNEDVPDRFKEADGHNGPVGHVVAAVLSKDGTRLAALRERGLYTASLTASGPGVWTTRIARHSITGAATLAFSPDGKQLALGFKGTEGNHVGYQSIVFAPGARTLSIARCGDGIAWLADNHEIACENAAGTHVRSLATPATDAGPAAPPSDLPILTLGNALWAIGYQYNDWQDPKKPLPLTLTQLGTGKTLSITVPSRP